ncbi:acyltransferase [Rhodopirellula halodulae]|uniref:acyltransferase n=1 Tax=Rhodopirellula halodulae TaxID=2894198 RepID=UPI0027D2A03C|nr:acyltransferase [Rhodopirellula sp. JC740]
MGVFQKVTIKAFRSAELKIGDRVGMSGVSISCSLSIEIGNDVLLGSGAVITDSDAHPLHFEERADASKIARARVVIEDGAFIGARAIVLKGVRIGRGAVVGAGAVVSRDVPAMSVVAGNPAKVVKVIKRHGE